MPQLMIALIGDICSAICKMEDGTDIVMVVVFISPNQDIQGIVENIYRVLLEYTDTFSRILKKNLN